MSVFDGGYELDELRASLHDLALFALDSVTGADFVAAVSCLGAEAWTEARDRSPGDGVPLPLDPEEDEDNEEGEGAAFVLGRPLDVEDVASLVADHAEERGRFAHRLLGIARRLEEAAALGAGPGFVAAVGQLRRELVRDAAIVLDVDEPSGI